MGADNDREPDNHERDIDFILNEIGGTFGRFQIFNYVLYSLGLCYCGMTAMSYVFTTMNLEYRCIIPECDYSYMPEYATNWLENFIPSTNSKYAKCERYEMLSNLTDFKYGYCVKDACNTSNIVSCARGGFVFKTNEVSIVNEFNMTCASNDWLVHSVGSINNIARLLFMPLSGILSDKIGRRLIMTLAIFISSITGIVQSFSTSYAMFIVCEFLNAGVLCSAYPAAVLLCMEWSQPQHRVTASSIAIITYPMGLVLTGLVAAYSQHFRVILRFVSGAGLGVVALLLLSSESLRWLLVKGEQQRVEAIIASAAKWNNVQVSPQTMEMARNSCQRMQRSTNDTASNFENQPGKINVLDLFKHKALLFRFGILSFCWMSGTFIVFGVSILSISLNGDKYSNFIMVGLGGMPATVIVITLLKYIGRRQCTSVCLLITSAAIISTKLIPTGYGGLALTTFLLGRCFSSVALSSVYISTSELWPTSTRHTMMSLSSTFGRVGAILAPLTPLLANISEALPFVAFCIVALASGILIVFIPETCNEDLPDTIEETLNLGSATKNVKELTSGIDSNWRA